MRRKEASNISSWASVSPLFSLQLNRLHPLLLLLLLLLNVLLLVAGGIFSLWALNKKKTTDIELCWEREREECPRYLELDLKRRETRTVEKRVCECCRSIAERDNDSRSVWVRDLKSQSVQWTSFFLVVFVVQVEKTKGCLKHYSTTLFPQLRSLSVRFPFFSFPFFPCLFSEARVCSGELQEKNSTSTNLFDCLKSGTSFCFLCL